MNSSAISTATPLSNSASAAKAPLVHGAPAANTTSDAVHQLYPDTCAIKSQQLILDSYGLHISEDQLRHEAIAHGWYSPGHGTPITHVGKLLELHGLPIQRFENGNIFNLVNELAQGHQVLIGVDANELWHNGYWEHLKDRVIGNTPNHALLVSGVDTSDPANIKVIITDPGNGDYCREYPLDQFLDAWADSRCYMLTTTIPVPHIFDPFDAAAATHIPAIGQLTYDDFLNRYASLADLAPTAIHDFLSDAFPDFDFTTDDDTQVLCSPFTANPSLTTLTSTTDDDTQALCSPFTANQPFTAHTHDTP